VKHNQTDFIHSSSEKESSQKAIYFQDMGCSNRSILKTSKSKILGKLASARTRINDPKRTSIEVMTDIIEGGEEKESKLARRVGINLGNGRRQ
jgi:hypothetical protein